MIPHSWIHFSRLSPSHVASLTLTPRAWSWGVGREGIGILCMRSLSGWQRGLPGKRRPVDSLCGHQPWPRGVRGLCVRVVRMTRALHVTRTHTLGWGSWGVFVWIRLLGLSGPLKFGG